MPAKDLPDPEYLRQRLRYEPETGKLFWREHPDMPTHWNSRYGGAPAFVTPAKDGYRRGRLQGRSMLAHRVIWAMNTSAWPSGEIDHINGDPSDNRLENLRVVDRVENNQNAATYRNNSSGVTGVTWCRRERRWHAQIGHARTTKHIGYFEDFVEAVAARKAAEQRLGFHPNHGRNRS